MIYLLIVLIVAVLIVFVVTQSRGYDIVEYHLSTDKDITAPVRFVMLSDLHDTDVSHDGNKRLIRSIENIDPDFVILAGDMITSYMQSSYNSDITFDFLAELANRFTVYYGTGNHEQRYKAEPDRFGNKYEELVGYVKRLGIEFLSDSHTDRDADNMPEEVLTRHEQTQRMGMDDYSRPGANATILAHYAWLRVRHQPTGNKRTKKR